MGKWREIATCADGTFLRNHRIDATIEHFAKHLDDFSSDAAESQREHVSAEQHHGTHLRLRERIANATGVAANEVQLQLAELARADAHVGQLSESGVDSVN